jgi:hypothetical protein
MMTQLFFDKIKFNFPLNLKFSRKKKSSNKNFFVKKKNNQLFTKTIDFLFFLDKHIYVLIEHSLKIMRK